MLMPFQKTGVTIQAWHADDFPPLAAPSGRICTWYYVLLLLLAIYPTALSASGNIDQVGRELVERAQTRTNIFELPSFEMKASIRMDNRGSPITGTFLLIWNGPDQWREEISLPGYSEVTVGGKNTISIKRSVQFIPLQIDQLHRAIHYPFSFTRLPPQQNETVKKIRDAKINGMKARCVEITDHESRQRRYVSIHRQM